MSWLCHILVYMPIVCKIEIILNISLGGFRTRIGNVPVYVDIRKKGAAVGSIFMTFYFHYYHHLLFI